MREFSASLIVHTANTCLAKWTVFKITALEETNKHKRNMEINSPVIKVGAT